MTTAIWNGTGTGDWSNASNWSTGQAPDLATDVQLGGATGYLAGVTGNALAASVTLNNAAATLQLTTSATLGSGLALSVAGALTNLAGTIDLGGGPGGGWLSVGGNLVNQGTISAVAALDPAPALDTSQTNVHFIDVGGTFTNAGVLSSDSQAATATSGYLLSEVLVTAAQITNTGTVRSASGAGGFVELNTTTGSNTDQVINNGTFVTANSGGIGVMAPLFVNNGLITIGAGNDNFQISSAYAGGPFTAQTVTSGSGTIALAGAGSSLNLTDSQTFASGTIVLGGAGATIFATPDGNSLATPTVITFGSAATINASAASATITTYNNASNRIIENGTINASAKGGLLTISPALLTENGTIAITNGDTVLLGAATTGTGSITLAGGSSLEVGAAIAATDTVAFRDAAANLLKLDAPASFAAQIDGFAKGDSIDLAGVSASSAAWSNGVLAVQTLAGTLDLAMAGAYAQSAFAVASDGQGGSLITLGSATQPGKTFTLTTKADTVFGGSGNNTIIAATNTLSRGDAIDGGVGGTNTLELVGGGSFNLAAPASLTDVQVVAAQEAAGAARQTVSLRNGLDLVVNAASGGAGAGITINGANDASTINLGNGTDTVTLGSARETVNGGTGTDTFKVTAATIGATIHGGTGHDTLVVSGGGTATMGASISNVGTVDLAASNTNWTFTANATAGLVINDLSAGQNDVIHAGAAGQKLMGGMHDQTFVGFGSGTTTYADSAAAFNGATIANFSKGDVIDVTGLAFAKGTGVAFSASGAGAGDLTLTLNGAFETQIHLLGGLGSGSFAATSDGHGGTLIKLH